MHLAENQNQKLERKSIYFVTNIFIILNIFLTNKYIVRLPCNIFVFVSDVAKFLHPSLNRFCFIADATKGRYFFPRYLEVSKNSLPYQFVFQTIKELSIWDSFLLPISCFPNIYKDRREEFYYVFFFIYFLLAKHFYSCSTYI